LLRYPAQYSQSTARRKALPRLGALLAGLTAATAICAASSDADPGPGNPPNTPSAAGSSAQLNDRIRVVNAQLDQRARQIDQLDEQYNLAAAAVISAQHTATRAQQAADRAAGRYRAAHAQFVSAVRQRYESGPGASMGTLFSSASPQQYLDALSVGNYLSNRFAATMQDERLARTQAARAARRAGAALTAARTTQTTLAQRRAALRQEAQRFRQLLGTLNEQQQRERARARAVAAAKARAALGMQPRPQRRSGRASGTAPTHVPANVSDSVRRVIAFAEAQVGKSYGWGAAGPNAYDCSGLTMAAWRQAGVNLPHSAAGQYGYGTHVAYSQLRPGDLIFLYSPIGHVELYVGDDLAVSAADPSIGIVYVHPSRDMADYAGATRLMG
jgi:cell wall-associated NlpC family hydrolase